MVFGPMPAVAALATLTVGAASAAQVDASTPRAQHGLTVVSVGRGDARGEYKFPVPAGMEYLSGPRSSGFPGGIGLWVRGPKPPPAPRPKPGVRAPYVSYRSPEATARAVGGEALPAQAQRAYGEGMDSGGRNAAPPLYLVSVPGGYAPSLKAIDVSVGDGQGHNARWRITHLPASFHAITGAPAPRPVFRGGGVTLSVRAWRDSGGMMFSNPSDAARQRSVRYRVQAQVPPGTGWTLRIRRQQLEWEALPPSAPPPMGSVPPQYAARVTAMRRMSAVFTAGFGTDAPPVPPGYAGRGGMAQGSIQAPYAGADRFLRLQGELVRTAAAQESVTFHNLAVHARKPNVSAYYGSHYTPPPFYVVDAAPQTQTTPSGISISLLPLPNSPQNGFGFGGPEGVRLFLKFAPAPPGPLPVSLPRSPLARKYHKPVSYSLRAPSPYYLEVFGFGSGFSSPGGVSSGQVALLRTPFAPPTRVVRNGRTFYESSPPAVPKHLDHLTLTVVQRTELRSIPVSFLVPIGAPPPSPTRRVPPGLHPPLRHP